jgi:hypothetical protein
MAKRRKPNPTMADRPVTIHISSALLETARAAIPPVRDWTGSQIAGACVAMAIKRIGTVHTD